VNNLDELIDEALLEWDKLEGRLPYFDVFLKSYVLSRLEE